MTPSVLVAERSRRVDVLWGFLVVVFAAALVRGHAGAATTSGRVVIDAVFGALLVAAVGAWVWFRRHPARLEVTPEVIAFWHRGQRGVTRLTRPGELHVSTSHVGGTPLRFLKVTGSDATIPLAMFDVAHVRAACRASGWRFVGDP